MQSSMDSSIKINSISIDLAGASNEIGVGVCKHFSIRGFVAEIREIDRGKCWPFSSTLEDQSYTLPSLSAPKSRWWRCTSCLKDINTKKTIDESDCQLHPNSRTVIEKKVDGNASIIPIESDWNPPISGNKNEIKADNAGKSNDGNDNVIYDEKCRKDDQTATSLKKVRRKSTDAATVRKKNRKLASPDQTRKKSKEKVNVSVEINWKVNQEAVNGHTFGSSDIAGVVDDTPKATKNRKDGCALMEPDERDHVPSESVTMFGNLFDHSPDNVTGLQQRKTRKVRLLSELLGKGCTKNSSNVIFEESLFKMESIRGRKRKLSGDEEWKPPEITPENNYANRKSCTIGKTSEIVSHSYDSDQSMESQSTDSEFDRDPIKGKQKNRRFQVVDEHLPAISWENSQKGIQENDGDSSKSNPGKSNFPSSVNSTFSGKELVPCPLHTQITERKLSSVKKKSKKPVVDNKRSTIIAFGASMAGGNQIETRKSNLLQTSYINTVPPSTRDISNQQKGFDSSLDTLFASEGYVRKYTPQVDDDRPSLSFSLQGRHHPDDYVRLSNADPNHSRDLDSGCRSSGDGCLRAGVPIDLSCNSNNKRPLQFLNEKLRHPPSNEAVDHSLVPQMDASEAYNKGKGVLVQTNHNTKEKSPEHIDDIPMEIVELLAKNQYERCLPDDEEDTTNKQPPKNGLLIDLNKTYENGISQEDNTSRHPKPRDKSFRKDDVSKGKQFLTANQNSVECFPISQFGRSYMPSGLGLYPLTREKPSSSIQFSGIGRPHGQNCPWMGNVPTLATQSHSPSSFCILRPCNTCQSVPLHYREASRPVWPSSFVPQNQLPVSYNMPQKFIDQSKGTSNDLTSSWNLNFVDNAKKKHRFDSEFSFGCKHSGIGGRSSDPYSNESSIPAMHLLSLMDPRLRSNPLVDLPGNPKVTKRPISQAYQSKEFLGLQPGDCSKTMTNLTKQLDIDFNSKRSAAETSRGNFAVIPAFGMPSLSFQSEKGFSKSSGFTVQAPWNHHLEKKSKSKEAVSPSINSKRDTGKFQILGASDSMMMPLKFHTTDYAKKHKAKRQSGNASALPVKSNCGPILCSINRNPADFTIPEPGNIYMIKGEDLKVRKRGRSRKKPSLCNQDALKENKKVIGPASKNA